MARPTCLPFHQHFTPRVSWPHATVPHRPPIVRYSHLHPASVQTSWHFNITPGKEQRVTSALYSNPVFLRRRRGQAIGFARFFLQNVYGGFRLFALQSAKPPDPESAEGAGLRPQTEAHTRINELLPCQCTSVTFNLSFVVRSGQALRGYDWGGQTPSQIL